MRITGRGCPVDKGADTLCVPDIRAAMADTLAKIETVEPLTRRPDGTAAGVLRPGSASGAVLALLAFAASVVPSLLPRSWMIQGVVSGVVVALGYAAGVVVGVAVRLAGGGRLPPGLRLMVTMILNALAGGLALWSLVINMRWQSDVRPAMGLPPAALYYPIAVTALAGLTATVLVLTARATGWVHSRYLHAMARAVPPRWAHVVRLLLAVCLLVVVVDVVLAGWVVGAARDAFAKADARYEVDVRRPVSDLRSGGPGSGLAWETLGRMGRAFTGSGPTTEELAAFNNAPATPPIRVYVGLRAAGTARSRAELAVAELERTGAFERDVLLVVNPTGTGWVDPAAIDPLEYLYNGNTAAVAVQYSYQPSWATMLGNQDRAIEGARALFDAVHSRLQQEPPAARPQLLLYGQSLGSFGSEQLFTSLDDAAARVDGVLWAGPPRANPLWRQLVDRRDPSSPVWQPVYDGGRTVRFGTDGAALSASPGAWTRPRIAYLQNASDPITWWSSRLLFERPEWMDDPLGPGVSERMPFVPIVTCVQIGLDLLQSTGVPPGHGHVFGPAHAEAWALIAPPRGWSPGDTARLVAVIAEEGEQATRTALDDDR